MFKDAWREFFLRLNEIYLRNWWGRIWLLIMAASIAFVVYCVNYSPNNSYITWMLCLVFWSFIALILIRLIDFSWKIRLAIFVGALSLNFCVGIVLLLVSYNEREHTDEHAKIERGYELVCDYLRSYFNGNMDAADLEAAIRDEFKKPKFTNNNLVGKIDILIIDETGKEYYKQEFANGVQEKYDIVIIDNSSNEEVGTNLEKNKMKLIYRYAGRPNLFNWWKRTLTFFIWSTTEERDNFISSGVYKHSLGFFITFFFLVHFCIYVAYVNRENTLCKKRLEKSNAKIKKQQKKLKKKNKELEEHKQELEGINRKIEEQNMELQKSKIELEERNKELQESRRHLEEKSNTIEAQNEELEAQNEELQDNKKVLEKQNVQLQEKNDKLNRFELVYNRMMADVKKTAKYDPMQSLQVMAFSWRDFIDAQIRSGRHSLRNGVTGRVASEADLKAFEDELYAMVINPTVEKIVSHLNKTVDMIDTAPAEMTIKKMYDEICRHIESKHFKSRAERKHIFVHTDYAVDGAYVCNLNLYRLKAIVENLCFNTQQAFFKKRDELEDAGDATAFDTFDVSVGLTFSIAKKSDREYLCIDYRDNATGFQDDLLPIIYHSPVPSAKDGDRKGEGTMYISFFVEDMKGMVEAENQIDEKGRKWAVTKIFIPVKAENKEV